MMRRSTSEWYIGYMLSLRAASMVSVSMAVGFLLAGTVASAHFSGNSWEYRSGPYVMDIGYDTDVFYAGSYVRFDFVLKDEATLEPTDFSEVWVRVVEGERSTLLATGVHHQSVGPTTFLYVFPKAGTYRLEASYRNTSGNDLATTSFPIVVKKEPGWDLSLYAAGAAGALFGAIVYGLINWLRRNKTRHAPVH